jgi:hypothetical protein
MGGAKENERSQRKWEEPKKVAVCGIGMFRSELYSVVYNLGTVRKMGCNFDVASQSEFSWNSHLFIENQF